MSHRVSGRTVDDPDPVSTSFRVGTGSPRSGGPSHGSPVRNPFLWVSDPRGWRGCVAGPHVPTPRADMDADGAAPRPTLRAPPTAARHRRQEWRRTDPVGGRENDLDPEPSRAAERGGRTPRLQSPPPRTPPPWALTLRSVARFRPLPRAHLR